MTTLLVLAIIVSVVILSQYNPAPSAPQSQVTFEDKMAHLQTGAPLPEQKQSVELPRWMLGLILTFIIIQILPLVLAAYKSRHAQFSRQDLRQIEFLVETPLFLGLLGSLLGVCMTQFLSGTLSAPLAYLTTISGILLYLFGRFSILVALPSSNDQV